MKIREIITEVVDKETGEVVEVSNFENGLLYGKYAVTNNQTVREKEKLMVRWWNKKKEISGSEMIKTNRGYFLDGYHLDEKSTELWFRLTGNDRSWRPSKKKFNKKNKK
jgi:hypothetical protein